MQKKGFSRRVFALLALACLVLVFPEPAPAVSPEELPRVEALLAAVERETGLVFIRNGSEYTAREAAGHLRLKLRKAGHRVNTAEEFIDHLASSSSFSGKPYMIRQPGREPEPAGAFLHRLLRGAAPK